MKRNSGPPKMISIFSRIGQGEPGLSGDRQDHHAWVYAIPEPVLREIEAQVKIRIGDEARNALCSGMEPLKDFAVMLYREAEKERNTEYHL